MKPVSLHVLDPQAQQLAGAQARHDGHTVGVDALIRLDFSTADTGIGGEQDSQRIRLKYPLAFESGGFGYGQLVLWAQCSVSVLSCPLDKGDLYTPDALQGLAGQVTLALAGAIGVEVALFVRPVEHVLQQPHAQITDALGPITGRM